MDQQMVEATAHGILRQLSDGWNAGDGVAYGAPFTDDAGFVDIRGAHHTGRDAIARGHQAIFDTVYRGSTLKLAVLNVRALTDDVILVQTRNVLNAPAGPMAGENAAIGTLVLVRDGTGWRIAAAQNTLVLPTPPR